MKRQANQPIEELEKNLRSSTNLKNQNANQKEFLSPKGLGVGKLKKIEKLR